MLKELEVAVDLALRAGEEILEVRSGRFDVEMKDDDQGPVTIADQRADALIRRGLLSAFPNDALLTEESPDDLARLTSSRVWIVDPLDGTKQFVELGCEYAVMIGLAIDGRSVLGVVHLPAEQRTYVAAQGEGAREHGPGGAVRRLELDPHPPDPGKLRVAVSRSHFGRRTSYVMDTLNPATIVRSGSVGRKAALVAAGEVDLYISMGTSSRHWDACAPEAVVRFAGGAFLDAQGRPMVYNTEHTRNHSGLLACRTGLVESVTAIVARVMENHPR